MNDPVTFFSDLVRSLTYQAPYLLAYLVCIAVIVVNWRRWPTPCLMALVACLIKLISSVSYGLAAAILLPRELGFRSYELASFVISLIDASAYGLLVLAIFQGRSTTMRHPPTWAHEPDDEPRREKPLPVLPPPDNSGIQERKPI